MHQLMNIPCKITDRMFHLYIYAVVIYKRGNIVYPLIVIKDTQIAWRIILGLLNKLSFTPSVCSSPEGASANWAAPATEQKEANLSSLCKINSVANQHP